MLIILTSYSLDFVWGLVYYTCSLLILRSEAKLHAWFFSHIWCNISVETGLAGGLAYTNNLLPSAPVGLLGLLLLFQVATNNKLDGVNVKLPIFTCWQGQKECCILWDLFFTRKSCFWDTILILSTHKWWINDKLSNNSIFLNLKSSVILIMCYTSHFFKPANILFFLADY